MALRSPIIPAAARVAVVWEAEKTGSLAARWLQNIAGPDLSLAANPLLGLSRRHANRSELRISNAQHVITSGVDRWK